MSTFSFLRTALVCGSFSFFVACEKSAQDLSSENALTAAAPSKAKGGGAAALKGTTFYALTASNELVLYSSGNPLMEISAMPITGLRMGERLLAIDFRPATGELYSVSNASQLYTINTSTGMATAVGAPLTTAINGSTIGFDFNPTVDRIRLVTDNGQNLRINPTNGVAIVDGMIKLSNADINAVAYTNSFLGATSTLLYDIDAATDMLYIQRPPNDGTLEAVGPLGVQVVGEGGFDIAPDNSVAIAALFGRGFEEGQTAESNGNKYRFYYINLMTGAAMNAGKTDRIIIGLAIAPNQ